MAKHVSETAKFDSAQEKECVPRLADILVDQWVRECERSIDLEKAQWTETTREKLFRLASTFRVPWKKRVLYYQRFRHLRYLVILVSGALVAFLCQDITALVFSSGTVQTVFGWYLFSIFGTLVGFPLVSAFAAGTKDRWTLASSVQRTVTGLLLLGLIAMPLMLLVLLLWQLRHHVIIEFDWLMLLLAVPISICGCILVWAETIAHPPVFAVAPFIDALLLETQNNSQLLGGDLTDQMLLSKAIDVCGAAKMDDDDFHDDKVKDIYRTLLLWRDEYIEQHKSLSAAVELALRRFGPTEGAADQDPRWFRILFYLRHQLTRYVAIVGLGLAIVFLRLLTSIHMVQTVDGNVVLDFGFWGDNVVYSSILAIFVLGAKAFEGTKVWWLKYLMVIPIALILGKIGLQAVVAMENIDQNRGQIGEWIGFLALGPMLSVALALLLCCVVSEFISPLLSRRLAIIRRRAKQISEYFIQS